MKKIILIIVSLCLSLFAGEVFVRFIIPQKTLSIVKSESLRCYRRSNHLPYEYIPNCKGEITGAGSITEVNLNNLGLRSHDIVKKENKRILLLGDSFIFGYGVKHEETIGRVLEKQLGVEVIPVGFVGGTATDMEFLYAKYYGMNLEPDMVVLAIFPYNDLGDLNETSWIYGENGELIKAEIPRKVDADGYLRRGDILMRYKIPLVGNSHLMQFIIDRTEAASRIWRARLALKMGWRQQELVDFNKYGDCLYAGDCSGKWLKAEEKMSMSLSWIKQLAQDRGVQLEAIIIPYEGQIFDGKPQKTVFHKALADQDIEYLDLWEAFKYSGLSREDLYLPDGHWTRMGHQFAAQVTGEWIKAKGLNEN